MTWFKVDDSFYDHPKIAELSMAARGLWVTAGSYCGRHLTDGHITKRQVRKLGGTPAQMRDLIANGVWIECQSHRDCYAFHDWIDMQPSREAERKRLADQAERKRRSRNGQSPGQPKPGNVTRDNHRDVTRDVHCDDHVTLARVAARPRRPDPTRPKEKEFGYVSGEGYVSNARENEPPTPHCPRHPGGTPDPCAACKHARMVREAWDTTLREQAAGARRTRRQRIDTCEWCDNQGIRIEPGELAEADLPAVKCDHTPMELDAWRQRFEVTT